MNVVYPFRIWEEDGDYLIQGFEPLENVLTYGENIEDAIKNGREALTGVLGVMLDNGQKIPEPLKLSKAKGVYGIEPEPSVSIPILVRKAREEAGLTLAELAAKLGVTYQAVQKWERSGTNPKVATLSRVLEALGRRLELKVA